MTGRIQIVRPDGGITTLPEDCKIVVDLMMVGNMRRNALWTIPPGLHDAHLAGVLSMIINGDGPEVAEVTPEMEAAGAVELKSGGPSIPGPGWYLAKATKVYIAMEAVRPKGEK